MNISKIIYYLRETKFCLTAINFSVRKCVNRTEPRKHFNASTYKDDKGIDRFKEKAVEMKLSWCIKGNPIKRSNR